MSGVRAKCIFIKTVNVTAVWTMLHTYTVVVIDTFHVPSHFKQENVKYIQSAFDLMKVMAKQMRTSECFIFNRNVPQENQKQD